MAQCFTAAMSKRANHWYLVSSTLDTMRNARRSVRVRMFVVWLVMIAIFFAVWQFTQQGQNLDGLAFTQSRWFVPLVVGGIMVPIFLWALWQRRRFRSAYLAALAHPGPEKLVTTVQEQLKAAALMADWDAYVAHAKALAYAFYGQDERATEVLAAIGWEKRAPFIQALGLSAEGIVELLCRRNPQRALVVTQRARELADVAGALPGAAQARRFHGACAAVAEVLTSSDTPESRRWLEEAAADGRFPQLQLIASLGLALAAERAHDRQRAGELRLFLERVAPHCRPFRFKADDFSASDGAAPAGPVSAMVTAVDPAAGAVQASAAKGKLAGALGRMALLWLLLLAMFALVYALFTP
jgi:hypothetical protein